MGRVWAGFIVSSHHWRTVQIRIMCKEATRLASKRFTALVAAALVLALVGCGGKAKNEPTVSVDGDKVTIQGNGTQVVVDGSGAKATSTDPAKAYDNKSGSGTTTIQTGGMTVTSGSTSAAKGGASWCEAGFGWKAPASAQGGLAQAKIIGLTQFKGKTYCQAEYSMEGAGQAMKYTYYFNEASDDMWMIMDVGGQKQEIHITD